MKNRDFAFVAIVIILGASVTGGLLYYFVRGGGGASQSAPSSTSSGGSSGHYIQITSVNLSSSYSYLTVEVKNTGSLNLVGVQLSFSPGGGYYSGGWNPNPSSTYPIYPGESIRGTFLLGQQYRPGIQVSVQVTGSFSNGQYDTATYVVAVQ